MNCGPTNWWGGSVTLRFAPGSVTIVAAVPRNDDFDFDIDGSGTDRVDVEFESDDHRSRLRGWWDDRARDRVEEDPRSSASDDGDSDDSGSGGD